MTLAEQFIAARRVSTPLVSISTPDPAATIRTLCDATNGAAKLEWDIIRGLHGINEPGTDAKGQLGNIAETDPIEVLVAVRKLPERSILFFHNAGRLLESIAVIQAVWNLRDTFKASGCMLVLLGPAIKLPPELTNDVLALDEPLPDAAQLAEIVRTLHADAEVETSDEAVSLAVEAVQGLAAFPAEQAAAMAMRASGLDLTGLWERKRKAIEQTPGLKVYRGGETFADVGGVPTIKEFLGRIVHGKARPNAIVFIDEIEKAMAGTSGDMSGVSQDQLGVLLSYMQDQAAAGVILVGPPGAAKSLIAKATGNEAGIPTIQLDLGAAKGSLVGQSEQQLRTALKVVSAVSNGRSLWVATCNSLSSLPPELRRRFSLGIFYFDLPTREEREAIWQIWMAKYSLAGKAPSDEGWTGAEIKQCCDLAWRLDCSLADAARYVVPVSRSAADQLEKLRDLADGKFLSASQPGVYRRNHQPEKPKASRKMALRD